MLIAPRPSAALQAFPNYGFIRIAWSVRIVNADSTGRTCSQLVDGVHSSCNVYGRGRPRALLLRQGNDTAVDGLTAPSMVDHFQYPANVPVPARYQLSLEPIKQNVSQFHTTFPDFRHTVELQVAEGDLVVTRLTARGTHTGEYRA